MGVLQRFERRLEGMVGSAFARMFKGKVHPAEIARALQREAEEKRVVVGEGRVLVPNRYVVTLGPGDYQHLAEWERQLTATLADMVHEYVDGEGWSTFGRIGVAFARHDSLRTGVFTVDSAVDPEGGQGQPGAQGAPQGYPQSSPQGYPQQPAYPQSNPQGYPPVGNYPQPGAYVPGPTLTPGPPTPPPVAPGVPGPPSPAFGTPMQPQQAQQPVDAGPPTSAYIPPYAAPRQVHVLVVDGPNTRFPLREGSNVIGRGHDAQVKLPDTGVSRRHVDLVVSGASAVAHDLGSTNGTIVNGQRVGAQQLRDGDVLRIGHSVLVYRYEMSGPGSGAANG